MLLSNKMASAWKCGHPACQGMDPLRSLKAVPMFVTRPLRRIDLDLDIYSSGST